MEKAKPRLDAALRGEGLIENASFFTLDEAFALIDSLECEPYMVPCNCKSVALNCEKPRSVCILFKRGLNSEWDRGHGRPLSKEEAKAILRLADKSGLMHTSEEDAAICNCCGDCCYPIRASKRIGTQGVWPKQRYRIIWDEKKCVACGRCAKVCNFGAFRQAGRKITFEEKDCWGCTICGSNCPVGAISIEKI
ncbi:4Fe-4S dicluster-binding protein [Cloacibacillus evryensis]